MVDYVSAQSSIIAVKWFFTRFFEGVDTDQGLSERSYPTQRKQRNTIPAYF